MREEALLRGAARPAPPQVGQVFGFEPGLAPVPEQASQVTAVGMRISRRLAGEGVLQGDLEVVAQVGAALAPAGPRPGRAAPPIAEDVLEDVRQKVEAKSVPKPGPPAAALPFSKAAWPKRS